MTRRVASAILIIFALTCANAATADAAPVLSVKQARRVAARKAEKIRRKMLDDGAKRSGVKTCGRKSSQAVDCVIKVVGYDKSDDFSWRCWMPVTVKAQTHTDRLHGPYALRWGTPVCA